MHRSIHTGAVRLLIEGVVLEGELNVPRNASGIVIFAHGSGSSRHSPRNKYVASVLQKAGIGTLLVDLLNEDEDEVYENRFDIELLAFRLVKVVEWLWSNDETEGLPIGLFGASTGAAAALQAAATLRDEIKAVVSRGGRPDLVLKQLHIVTAPTLLIVGSYDVTVLELNKEAYDQLCCHKKLEVVPGATHLFEEEGALESVASLATSWYRGHFSEVEHMAAAGAA